MENKKEYENEIYFIFNNNIIIAYTDFCCGRKNINLYL